MELVGIGLKIHSGHRAKLGANHLVVPLGGVESGAHGGSADGKACQFLQRSAEHPAGRGDQFPPAGDLLAKAQGGCVLQVGAADADELRVSTLQLGKGRLQLFGGRQHLIYDAHGGGNMQRGGEGIVTGLGGVHMVIRVEGNALFPGQVSDDLVDIHVGLGAGAGLPDNKRKLLIPLSGANFFAGGRNGSGLLRRQLADLGVGPGAGGL